MLARLFLQGNDAMTERLYTQSELDSELLALRERCAKVCLDLSDEFLSPEYATGQPHSSFAERFACGQCSTAIMCIPLTPHTEAGTR